MKNTLADIATGFGDQVPFLTNDITSHFPNPPMCHVSAPALHKAVFMTPSLSLPILSLAISSPFALTPLSFDRPLFLLSLLPSLILCPSSLFPPVSTHNRTDSPPTSNPTSLFGSLGKGASYLSQLTVSAGRNTALLTVRAANGIATLTVNGVSQAGTLTLNAGKGFRALMDTTLTEDPNRVNRWANAPSDDASPRLVRNLLPWWC